MDDNQIEHLKKDLNFIQSYQKGVYKFLEPDSRVLFFKNKKHLGKDWFWYNGPEITYNINNDGFRMDKDFKDVNLDNYFLSLGCSHALGIGMPYDSLYTSIIAKEANVDPVILANVAHGMDTFFYNFFVWIEKYKKPPKFVLLGHSAVDRKTYWIGDRSSLYTIYSRAVLKGVRSKSYKEFLKYETYSYFDYRTKHLAIKKFCESNNILLIEFTGFGEEELLVGLDIPFIDYSLINGPLARDYNYIGDKCLAHPGYEYQEKIVNHVKKKLGL